MKKLPNIFKGIVNNDNNQKTSIVNKNDEVDEIDINKQINNIFNSDKFVYKSDTIITLNDGNVIEKTIIGKTKDSLIAMDGELIKVESIYKIDIV